MDPDTRVPESEIRNPAATPRGPCGGVSMETYRTCSCCRRAAATSPGRSRHGLSWISGPVSRTFWTLVLLLALHVEHCLAALEPPSFIPSGMRAFKDGNENKYFRFTTLDASKHHLYVGAMDYVYRLEIRSFVDPSSPFQYLRSSDLSDSGIPGLSERKQNCLDREHQGYECRNHIRAIIPKGNEVYLCGTGAFSPVELTLNNNLQRTSEPRDGEAICPFSPDQQNTIVYVESGNPFGGTATYSGTYMQSGPIIYRSQIEERFMRSADQDSKWLNEPTFVQSFDVGNYVYFFFRESALEYMNCGKAIYSRVARVCKNDKGSSTPVLLNHWTTYLKVRLNCSQPGEYPFYYNELRDVVKDGDNFHGVFTTNENGLHGSAVCSFSWQAIEDAFSGPFKEQKDSKHQWLRVPQDRIPDPRPGTCDLDSLNQADNVMQFIKARPLMDLAVEATGGKPRFHQPDTNFTHLAVDDRVGDGYSVLFLVTDAGQIQKVVQWQDTDGQSRSRVLATWSPFESQQTIWKLDFYSGAQGKYLFLSSDEQVTQLDLAQCSGYSVCTECVHDPYCGWDPNQQACVRFSSGDSSLIQDVKNSDSVSVCNSACKKIDSITHNIRVKGDAAHLSCDSHCETASSVTWFYKGQRLESVAGKHFVTKDNGLVILNIGGSDNGTYTCRAGEVILADHVVNLTDCGDADECWREEFRKWCVEFETYKTELNHWRCLKRGCTDVSYAGQCGISDSIIRECPAPVV